MYEFLDGFEKRMQILAAVDSIVNRSNRNRNIESLFEPYELDNIIFSVLVFIMERTLTEDEDCTIASISRFVGDILSVYEHNFSPEKIMAVTEYIVKDILQNGGEARYYSVMNYNRGLSPLRVRLIDDKINEAGQDYAITYQLTDQGYDLLFRTKEVEQEIRFTIEELKLRELIKRKNYKKAISQSRDLLQMVRQKKNEIQQFLQKIRENIYDVDIQEYESLVEGTYALLAEEYNTMNEIRDMIVLSEERLKEEENTQGILDADMRKAHTEILQIRRNINRTIDEQRELILERHSLAKVYKETIADCFSLSLAHYFDFEKEILMPMEKCERKNIPALWELLTPLFMPKPNKHLNILSLYERQSRIRQDEQTAEGIQLEDLREDREQLRIKQLNEANTAFVNSLLSFSAIKKESFRFSELYEYIKGQEELFAILIADDLLFKLMLKLYDQGSISIQDWKQQNDDVIADSTGELDLNYCLYCIEENVPDFYGIKKIEIKKEDEDLFRNEFVFREDDAQFKQQVVINNFKIEVIFYE